MRQITQETRKKLSAAGKRGGQAKNKNKGFGSRTPEEMQAIQLKAQEARRAKQAK